MTTTDSPPPARCPTHGLALGPDGNCVRCRRLQTPRRPGGSGLLVLIGVLVLGSVVGFAAYRAFRRAQEDIAVEPRTAAARPALPPPAAAPVARLPAPASRKLLRINRRRDAGAPAAPAAARGAVRPRADAAPTRRSLPRPPDPDELLAVIRRIPITLYMAPWCPQCRRAVAWTQANQLTVSRRDIDEDPGAKQTLRTLNPRGSIPTFEIEGKVYVGFGEQRVWGALVEAARRRLSTR